MKICFIADPHFHSFQEFGHAVVEPLTGIVINSRLLDQLTNFMNIAKDAKQRGCARIVINGDLFHTRGSVPVDVYQFVYVWLETVAKQLGLGIAILVGNHDQVDKSGSVHSVYGLRRLVTVCDRADMLKTENITIYCIPYTTDHDKLMKLLDAAPKADILFAHLGVDGAAIGPVEYRIKDPITVEALHPERYKFVLLGHYHKPQKLAKNVYYIGSPAQINRGEVGETKRWMLWDSDKPDVIESIETHAKEFKTITGKDLLIATPSLLRNYYDVLLDGTEDMEAIHEKMKGLSVKLIPPRKDSDIESRIQVDETMTDEQLLTEYIKYTGVQASPKLLDLGLQLLQKGAANVQNNTRLSFLRLVIDNFMVIGRADLKLHSPGSVIALQGDNEGTDGFTSNGAGKSSLLPESIFWCLWGETARGVPADKVVNNKRKRDCSVQLLMLAGNRKLDVTRYRKHKKLGGNGLRLFIDGVDCTEGTADLTQVRLNKELGVDYTTFASVMAFSPDTLRFVSDTDANQKHVLDSILQTRRFTAALEVTKQALSVVKQQGLSLSQEEATHESTLAHLEELQQEYAQRNDRWEEAERERVDELAVQIARAEANLKTIQEIDVALRKESVAQETKISELQDQMDDPAILTEQYVAANTALVETQTTVRERQKEHDKTDKLLEAAVEQAGKPCPTCGQKVANTGKLIANYQSERNRMATELEALRLRETQQLEHKKQIQAQRTEYNQQKELLDTYKDDLEETYKSISLGTTKAKQQQENIERLTKQVEAVPTNEYASLLSGNTEKISTATGLLETARIALKRNKIMTNRLNFWLTGFGTSGVRSLLLDLIIPQLTEYANGFADKLAGGSIQIGFQTHKEGTAQDKFTVKAWNLEGADVYKGNSSGEKRRIDVAIMLALFRIAYNRTRLNILLLDEALDTLDVAGLESVVGMLEDLAKELKLTIYVTSHTPLTSMLHESLTIKKSDGVSSLVA